MKFRIAKKKDIPRLVELVDQLGYRITQEELELNLEHYGDSAFLMEDREIVLGLLAYHILPQFHSKEKHMRIVSLVVDRKWRNQGLGKQFLKEAERIAKERGCVVVELTSASHRIQHGAHAFYTNQGYKADGEKVYFRKKLLG